MPTLPKKGLAATMDVFDNERHASSAYQDTE
jgi:hypothetical protein